MKKNVTWLTNYNNKLYCNGFLHVDTKPSVLPTEEQMASTVIHILTADQSFPGADFKLTGYLVFQLNKLTDQIALASHGKNAVELADELMKKHPHLNFNHEVVLYFYQSIK